MADVVSNLIFKADTAPLKQAESALDGVADAANDASRAAGNYVDANGRMRDANGRFVGSSKKATSQQKKFAKQTKETTRSMKGMITGLVAMAGGLTLAHKFKSINEDFTRMDSMLITATGSVDAAASKFKELQEFAATTPFALAQSVEGFVMLKNLGLDPTMESMTAFGNFASAMGRDLNSMIRATAAASTMEFEALKTFGIKTIQEAEHVQFIFQGVTTRVEKNAADIVSYLQSIGREKFGDAMEQQAAVFVGASSNLSDAFDTLFIEAGRGGALDSMTESFRSLADSLSNPQTIAGAQAVANMMASIVGAVTTGFADLLTFIGKLENMAGLKIGTDGEGFTIISRDSVEGLSLTQEKITNTKNQITELEGSINNLLEIYVAASQKASEGGILENIANAVPGLQSSAELINTLSDPIERLKTRLQEAKDNLVELQNQFHEDQGTVFTSIGNTPLEGSQSAGIDPITGESSQMSMAGDQSGGFFEGAMTPEQIKLQQDQEAIAEHKAVLAEFEQWKADLVPTELERLQEEYLAKEEAKQAHNDKLLEIESNKAQGLADIAMDEINTVNSIQTKGMQAGMNMLVKLAQKKLGDSKASAMAGVALGAAGAYAQIMIEGFMGSQAIRAGHQLQASLIADPTGATQAAIIAKGEALATANMAKSKTIAAAAAAVKLGTGAASVALGGGSSGGSSSGGASVTAQSAAEQSPIQNNEGTIVDEEPQQTINVTIDGSIDPSGARKIVEAINEVTEDGLQINALVGT